MNSKFIGKAIAVSALFGFALIFSAASQAVIISGSFTLQQDVDVLNGIQAGEVVATINFDASSIDPTPTNVNGLSIFNVDRLELTDLTSFLASNVSGLSMIGDYLYEQPTGSSIATTPIQAFFNASGNFAGLQGALMDFNPLRSVTFSINGGVELSTSTAGTFLYSTTHTYIDSFAQVPEPGPLALLGAGLIAFGVVRLRAADKSTA